MKRQRPWTDKLLQTTELFGETPPLLPVLELCGDQRVLIENHFGISEYSLERICVEVRFGQLTIIGCDLRVRKMQGEVLVIVGTIEQIVIKRGRR